MIMGIAMYGRTVRSCAVYYDFRLVHVRSTSPSYIVVRRRIVWKHIWSMYIVICGILTIYIYLFIINYLTSDTNHYVNFIVNVKLY